MLVPLQGYRVLSHDSYEHISDEIKMIVVPADSSANRLLLVRHGETDWNVTGRLNSRTDLPLNEAGVAGVRSLAASLRAWPLTAIVSSPLSRASASAILLAEGRSIEVNIDPSLIEVDFGPFEGATPAQLRQDTSRAAAFAAWSSEVEPQFPHGVETLDQASARAERFLQRMAELPGSKLVVTHGAFLRVLLASCVLGMPASYYQRLRVDNASLSIVSWDDGVPRLVGFNLRGG